MECKAILFSVILCMIPRICRSCNCTIPHGKAAWCERNQRTPYECDDGYQATADSLLCSKDGEWSSLNPTGVAHFCTPKSCPDKIPNGALSPPCPATVGYNCHFTCNDGYWNRGLSNIICRTSANWSVNPHKLCKGDEDQCPYEVTNGDLDLSCRRHVGDSCSFKCRYGYIPSQLTPVTCNSTLHWSQPLHLVCQAVVCPATIENGYIKSSCTRKYPESCYDYECNTGFMKSSLSPTHIKCNASGHWEWYWTQENLCTRQPATAGPNHCPPTFPGGFIDPYCDTKPNSTCEYTCDHGCNKTISEPLSCTVDLYWSGSLSACSCPDSTPHIVSPVDNKEAIIAGSIACGLVVLLILFGIAAFIYRRKRKSSSAQADTGTQLDASQPRTIPSAPFINTSEGSQYVSLQIEQNSDSTTSTTNRPGLPAYSTLHSPDAEESPPSYDQVIASSKNVRF